MTKIFFALFLSFYLIEGVGKAHLTETRAADEISLMRSFAGNGIGENARSLLNRAEEAQIKINLEAAKELLNEALASHPSEEERSTAERRLATLEWRFYSQFDAARAHLALAEALKVGAAEALLERARMEISLANYADARRVAEKAILEAADEKTLERAKIALATVEVSRALSLRLDGYKEAEKINDAEEKRRFEKALKLLLPIVRDAPGQLAVSRLQLALSLLLGDGPNALAAWRSYYRVSRGNPPGAVLSPAYNALKIILTNWSKTKISKRQNERLAEALAGSRFFDEAALVASQFRAVAVRNGSPNKFSRASDITEYASFCRRLQKLTDEYYRRTALKQGDAEEFRRQFLNECERLWKRLNWAPGGTPKFDESVFDEEMSKRFGAMINLGSTAGYLDLHMGHRVVDEQRIVSQYNHTASVRFISLDAIVSNGFESWAWDGRAQHGGWATASTITQIRPAYTGGALEAWLLSTDPREIKNLDEEIAKDDLADEAKARTDPYAFLPGLRKRLLREGREQLIARLRSEGLNGNALRVAFLAEYEKAEIESSIFAHEGRHAIDAALKLNLTDDEREFRAKLSEIAFAPFPRLSFGSIFDANIGDDSPHGKANLRIMKGIVNWMDANKNSITGLDPAKPLLVQFNLLSDEQMRAVFRSMDPLFLNQAIKRVS